MKIRHRVPSIFNLSMVDVLCCALGCVILLWLLNLREAKIKAAQAGRADEQVAALTKQETTLKHDLEKVRLQVSDWQARYALLQGQLTESERSAATTRSQLEAADKERRNSARLLATTEGELRDTSTRLAKAQNAREAAERTLSGMRLKLSSAEKEAQDLAGLLSAFEVAARETTASLAQVQSERDIVARKMAQLGKDLEAVKEAKALAEEGLILRRREAAEVEKKLSAAMTRVITLEGQVRERDTKAATSSQKIEGLEGKLLYMETRARELRALADLLPGLREKLKEAQERSAAGEVRVGALEKEVNLLKDYRQRLAAEEALAKSLEKEINKRLGELEARNQDLMRQKQALESAQRNIVTLKGEKKTLQDQAERVRAAVENRFAGMALTGRRVVFIVDMSGSMELVEPNKPAPEKWIGVRDTLAKIMRSLPDLEKFQVLLFSDRVIYLLGYEGTWIEYDQDSAKRVAEALSRVKPEGGTHMYRAFEAAFRFRSLGMDTLYLLSDGLPNLGEGLPADAARTMKETEISDILSKLIRKKLLSDWNAPDSSQRRVRINAVGFFYESPDVGAVLWALTRENDGSFVGMSKP